MPWLERPASVYTRFEVVLHRLDDPMLVNASNGDRFSATRVETVTFEVWEARFTYVFDAARGKWDIATVKLFGYRRGGRTTGPRIEITAINAEVRELAQKHAPDWVPEPSQKRLHLPAEDVWDEAALAAGRQRGFDAGDRLRRENPYRGE